MPYALLDVELTKPLPALQLSPTETGVGVLVRRRDRPVGFFLASLPAGARLRPGDLSDLIRANAAEEVLTGDGDGASAGTGTPSLPLDLTVAVCTRDRPELLRACLDSILRVRDTRSRRFQVVVVDNAPATGETRALVASLPRVRYIPEARPGLDFARNRALEEADTDVVAYVDDDVVVDRGWVAGLEDAWARHPDAAAVTGLVLPAELVTDAQIAFERSGGFRRGFQSTRYAGQHREGSPWYPTWPGGFGTGCNMAFRADAVRSIGGFDDALDTGPPLPGGGDLDMFYRVVRAGHALVYEPRALVFHRHRRDHGALRRQYWTWGTSFTAFLHKTYRRDPEMRRSVRHTAGAWLRGGLTELGRSLRGDSALSPDLVLAQIAGGLLTFPWMYPRSCRRTQRIRQQSTDP